MISIPWWLFSAMLAVIAALSFGLLYALVKREELADQRLERELAPPRLNPQATADRHEAGRHG